MGNCKKIAIVTPLLPYPPDSGSKIRIFNLIKILANEGFRLFLLSFEFNPSSDNIKILKQWCEEIRTIKPHILQVREPLYQRWRHKLWGPPFETRPELHRELNDILFNWKPDFIQAEKTIGAAYLDIKRMKRIGARILLEEGGVHHQTYERLASTNHGFIRGKLYQRRARRLKAYESDLIGKIDAVVSVSEKEKTMLNCMNSEANILMVPNGVDENIFKQEVKPAAAREKVAFFCGNLSYFPNANAVEMIIERIVPLLKNTATDLDIAIAGGDASEELKIRAKKAGRVHLLGYVSDIEACFRRYSMLLNPMLLGGGTRLKMLEAMAHGMACVSTSTGAEGIEIENGVHALLADSPEGLVPHLRHLLYNPQKANDLGRAARELVQSKYSWSSCVQELVNYYRNQP